MKRMAQTLQHLSLVLLALSLFGCGSSINQGNGTSSSNPSATTTTTTTPGTPTGATPVSTNQPTGQVTVTLSKQQYATEEPLLVTIHNGMNVSIWVQGQQTVCTSLTVERMTNGAWVTTGGCAPAHAPSARAIAAGDTVTQRIDFAQGMDTGAGWPAGTYRVTLHYTLSATASADASTQSQSATFIIN